MTKRIDLRDRSLALSVLVFLLLAHPSSAEDRSYFAGYGVFIQGVECVLFQALDGQLYFVTEPCPVGETAYIEGETYDCISVCMQGEICLDVVTLVGCTVQEEKHTWDALKSRYR